MGITICTDPLEFRNHPVVRLATDLVDGYTSNLKVSDKFNDGDKGREPPTTLLWSLFLKSHLLEKSGLITEALAVIEECVSHTPTALDMYIKKAKILRKLGDIQAAAETPRM